MKNDFSVQKIEKFNGMEKTELNWGFVLAHKSPVCASFVDVQGALSISVL